MQGITALQAVYGGPINSKETEFFIYLRHLKIFSFALYLSFISGWQKVQLSNGSFCLTSEMIEVYNTLANVNFGLTWPC